MTVDTVVTGSHIVLDDRIVDKNIVIDEGAIVGMTNDIPACDNKIDASGMVSIPGVIDTHVHYGVYSPIEKAAVTESGAAAVGGVTTMMRMLRLGGSYKKNLQEQLDASARSHHIDYAVHASIFDRSQADEMKYCTDNGITSFKIYMNLGGDIGHVYMDMNPGADRLNPARVEVTDDVVRDTIRNAARLRCPVLIHAEDYESCACGIKTAKEKKQDGLAAWSGSRAPEFEAKAISAASRHAREFDCTIYFVHIGSARALEQINAEKQKGTKIFTETCPHYLALSYEKQQGQLAKVMPPIRSESDIESVWGAIAQGQVNCIGTDHVANRLGRKLGDDIWEALAGFPGIGTMLPVLLDRGINRQRITLYDLVRLTSYNASAIFGMSPKKGTFAEGSDADITIIDLNLQKKVSEAALGGFSDYTVYDGWELKGWPVRTIVRGETVAENFEVVGKKGHGRLVTRSVV